jgi:hypothetical protein
MGMVTTVTGRPVRADKVLTTLESMPPDMPTTKDCIRLVVTYSQIQWVMLAASCFMCCPLVAKINVLVYHASDI